MTGVAIAHLTDVHLPSHGRFTPGELLGKRGLSALNWALSRRRFHSRAVADALAADVRAHRPDHVAMTGDVTNFGLPREFAAGAAWLGGLGAPVSFTPGNHDALMGGVENARTAAFSPFMGGTGGGEAGETPYLRRCGDVSLIGVSTACPTPPFSARGRVGAAAREALRARLAEAAGAVRIVLIHHPPTETATSRRHLIDRAEVAAVIAAGGAALVLCGHNHRNEMSWIDRPDGGRIPVLGAPSASTPFGLRKAAAEWRLIRVLSEEGAIEVTRRTLTAAGEFARRGVFRLTLP